jgi:PAS domain S-box-containing protein
MAHEPGLILLGNDGLLRWANSAALRVLGCADDELHSDLLVGPLSSKPATGFDASLAEGFRSVRDGRFGAVEGDARLKLRSGADVTLHWKFWVLPGSPTDGQILLSLTELGDSHAGRLVASEYRDIFESAVEGIFRSTVDGRFVEVNPALARLYGYATPAEMMDEMRDLNTQHYVEPDRRAEFLRLIDEQGSVENFESEVRRKDGTTIWVSEFARIVWGEDHDPLFFDGSVIDITEKRRAEEALKRSEERFRQLVESTNVVPWEADVETGRFTYVGPQALAFLGCPPEEWLGAGFWESHVHPEDLDWVTIVRGEAIAKRQSLECEYRMVRADETRRLDP